MNNKCLYCGKQITEASTFCSDSCSEAYAKYNKRRNKYVIINTVFTALSILILFFRYKKSIYFVPTLAVAFVISIYTCVLLIREPHYMRNANLSIKKTERRQRIFGFVMLFVCLVYTSIVIFMSLNPDYADMLSFDFMNFLFGRN